MAEVLRDLDRQFPGLRFRVIDEQDRMRPHMRFFLNGRQIYDLGAELKADDAIQIVQALSGG
jgi:molybdopterin synthase sulfur carrier subunit